MSSKKTLVLITGANGGLGFELATQLLNDASKHVLLGSRSVEKGETALKDLQLLKKPGSVEVLEVDVTNESSIIAAAKVVEEKYGRLDALVNNAGIAPKVEGTLSDAMLKAYETNVVGALLMEIHFVPLLRNSTGVPRIINVTSGQSSITRLLQDKPSDLSAPGIQYRASKTAMNVVGAEQVIKYEKEGFKIFLYCPGFFVSNLTPLNTPEYTAKPVSEGAAPMVAILDGERDADHGKLMHEKGIYGW